MGFIYNYHSDKDYVSLVDEGSGESATPMETDDASAGKSESADKKV